MLLTYYLADQNPHRDRSLGITEYSLALAEALVRHEGIDVSQIISRSSARLPAATRTMQIPMRTDRTGKRMLVDHLHGIFLPSHGLVHYPKGFLPFLRKSTIHNVCTLHDTIAQHYADKYPDHRSRTIQRYWLDQMKRTLRLADHVISISQHSSRQLLEFCERYQIAPPPITVCYQGAKWEDCVDMSSPEKGSHLVTLGSPLPHKRIANLLEFWQTFESRDSNRLKLVVVGKLDEQALSIASTCRRVSVREYLPQEQFAQLIATARATLFPSEIEGFGLPALESAYLGTPTVYVRGTAVEEVLGDGCKPWGFDLSDYDSFEYAIKSVISESPENLKTIAHALRARFSWQTTARRVVRVYRDCIN